MERHLTLFPLWLELSGLPEALYEKAKTASPWAVFKKIVELDMAANPARPGLVEIPLGELAARSGVEPARVEKAVKAMRKLGVARAFLPDSEEEPALFQLITPIPTPKSCDEVRASHPDPFLEAEWPPRYAVEVKEEEEEAAASGEREAKIRRVVDLYLNTFSMKINSIILDQLQMICDRYDLALIEKVFERAKKREARSLSWILSEIRREMKIQAKAEELRRQESQSAL